MRRVRRAVHAHQQVWRLEMGKAPGVPPQRACDFEKERMRRIERNREIMKQLGLGHGGGAMPNMAQAMGTKRKKKTQRSVVTDWNNRENTAMPLRIPSAGHR
ncbi:hypothetical protein PSENEW3_00002812 [Picochlorum sp. SENEW3]|nr:hypothetical protein PSENEW3_00002812 [Picochlorum sp. SENEW3]